MPRTNAPSATDTAGAVMLPSTSAVLRISTRRLATTSPLKVPEMTSASVVASPCSSPPWATVTSWPVTSIEPSTRPAMTTGSLAVSSHLITIDGPMRADWLMDPPDTRGSVGGQRACRGSIRGQRRISATEPLRKRTNPSPDHKFVFLGHLRATTNGAELINADAAGAGTATASLIWSGDAGFGYFDENDQRRRFN